MSDIIQPGGNFNRRYSRPDKNGGRAVRLDLDDFIDFNLTEYDDDELQNSFLDWVKDDSYFKKYDKWDVIKDNQIMFRVFRFEKEHSSGMLSPTGSPLTQLKILPFGKIIKSTSANFLPGEIIALPDDLDKLETNGTWLEWKKVLEKERPVPDLEEPPKYLGTIVTWRAQSKFVADKFHPDIDDEYTFIRNAFEFSIKYIP